MIRLSIIGARSFVYVCLVAFTIQWAAVAGGRQPYSIIGTHGLRMGQEE